MGHHKIDQLDKKILQMISKDARVPFLEIARECNVSGAAIHQRVQKLKDFDIIKGSEFIININKIGYNTCAFVGILISDISKLKQVTESLSKIPEIVECHFSTGKYSIFSKIYAKDNHHLFRIILQKVLPIDGVEDTETFQISLEELFNRQLAVFDVDDMSECNCNDKEEE